MKNALPQILAKKVFGNLAPEQAQQLADLVLNELYPSGFELIERNIENPGGQAFLLTDLFSLSDIWHAVGMMNGVAPEELAKLLGRLVKLWREVRRLREPLTEIEVQIMLAVKRGSTTPEAIVAATEIPLETVRTCIDSLAARRYNQSIPLIEKNDDEELVTRF
jgi:hypothetical protein